MADQPDKESQPAASADNATSGKTAVKPGDPQGTGKKQPNPIDVAAKKQEDSTKGLKAQGQSAQETVGAMDAEERDRLVEMAAAGEETLARKAELISANAHYAEKRKLYGEDNSITEEETERLERLNLASLEAFRQAQERASQWIAPEPVEGEVKPGDIEIIFGIPERDMHHSVQIRVLGEVENGFVTVYDQNLKDDIKEGRVAQSQQFGTKNRVRVAGTNDKGDVTKTETHLGYFDWGPLRMPPGSYRVTVEGWDGGELASETFKINPDADPEMGETEKKIAAMAAQQFARQQTKADTGKVLAAPKA